ncbi:hypothetical protein [Falsiroseomonas sp.]
MPALVQPLRLALPRLRPWRRALDWLSGCLARHHSRQDLAELSPHLRRDP